MFYMCEKDNNYPISPVIITQCEYQFAVLCLSNSGMYLWSNASIIILTWLSKTAPLLQDIQIGGFAGPDRVLPVLAFELLCFGSLLDWV